MFLFKFQSNNFRPPKKTQIGATVKIDKDGIGTLKRTIKKANSKRATKLLQNAAVSGWPVYLLRSEFNPAWIGDKAPTNNANPNITPVLNIKNSVQEKQRLQNPT